jgi:lipopolysaccharide transport system ATP-binding protein
VRFPSIPLLSGQFLWSVYVLDDSGFQVIDMAESIQPFTVLNQTKREFGLAWFDHQWVAVGTSRSQSETVDVPSLAATGDNSD